MKRPENILYITHNAVILLRAVEQNGDCDIKRIPLSNSTVGMNVDAVDHIAESLAKSEVTWQDWDNIALVLPADWSYHTLLPNPHRRVSRQAVSFAMEEWLPCSAEEVICTAMPIDGARQMTFALPRSPLYRLIHCLETLGLTIDMVTLDVLPAVPVLDVEQPAGLLIRDGRRMTAALLDAGACVPHRVRTAFCQEGESEAPWLHRQTRLAESNDPKQPLVWHCFDCVKVECIKRLAANIRSRGKFLALETDGLIGDSASIRLWNRLTWTGILTLAACLLLLINTHQSLVVLGNVQDAIATRQSEVFRTALPDVPLPPKPALRLASERIRLERIAGPLTTNEQDGLSPTDPLAPLTQMSQFVAGLTDSLRINVIEAAIDDRQFSLRGQTRDHRSAEQIAETVNVQTAWRAPPPRTSRMTAGGIEFSLRARFESNGVPSER